MSGAGEWTASLCACCAVVSIAEALLPEGAVKKTVYYVLSLVTAASLLSPIRSLSEFSFDIAEPEQPPVYTDWLTENTPDDISRETCRQTEELLRSMDVSYSRVEISADRGADGTYFVSMARITVSGREAERLDEIESELMRKLGITADVVVGGDGGAQ